MKNTHPLPEDVVEGEDPVFDDDAASRRQWSGIPGSPAAVFDEDAAANFNPDDKMYNGQRAEALLADPLLNAALAAVAERYRRSWETSARGDIDTQQAAHHSLAALKDVVAMIRKYVGNAKMREADLKLAQKRSQIRNY